MTADELREMIAYFEARVSLATPQGRTIVFEVPAQEALVGAGLNADGVRQLLSAAWLPEMVADVRETPDFCDPGDSPDQVLRYARDVVVEYFRKRFEL